MYHHNVLSVEFAKLFDCFWQFVLVESFFHLGQIGLHDGKLFDAVYGNGEPEIHLYFHYQVSQEDDDHVFGHFSVLTPLARNARAHPKCEADVLSLPTKVLWLKT